jgi:hypothetical protein
MAIEFEAQIYKLKYDVQIIKSELLIQPQII